MSFIANDNINHLVKDILVDLNGMYTKSSYY